MNLRQLYSASTLVRGINVFLSVTLMASFTLSAARAAVILSDGFESGKLFADATGYSGRVATIDAAGANTGANSLLLNNKEGVLYSLADTYQEGTYTVTYYAKRETTFAINLSFLTYGITGGYTPQVAAAYLEEPSLPLNVYTPVTFTATIDAQSAAFGKNIQLLVEQSRLGLDNSYKLRIDDLLVSFTPIPEPSAFSLLVVGLAGLAVLRRRQA